VIAKEGNAPQQL